MRLTLLDRPADTRSDADALVLTCRCCHHTASTRDDPQLLPLVLEAFQEAHRRCAPGFSEIQLRRRGL